MNRLQIEVHINNMRKTQSENPDIVHKLLTVNLFIQITTILFHKTMIFSLLIFIIAIFDIALSLYYIKRKSLKDFTCFHCYQLLIFIITCNCLSFALEKSINKFIWYEFVIMIFIQILAFILNFIFIEIIKPKAYNNDYSKLASSIAGLCCSAAMIACKVFISEILTVSVVVFIIILLLNFICVLLTNAIVKDIYIVMAL